MKTNITLILEFDEWQHLVPELEFLLKRVYGTDLDNSLPEIKMQIPNTLDMLLGLLQYGGQYTELLNLLSKTVR